MCTFYRIISILTFSLSAGKNEDIYLKRLIIRRRQTKRLSHIILNDQTFVLYHYNKI